MLSIYLGLFLLSAGTLLFEIALSRIFSISQWYHFAFMAVGLALLGGGASGSFLQLWSGRLKRLERFLFWGGVLFALSVVGGYLACNWLPFDSFRLGWDRVQFAYLAGYYLALMVPFFVSGGVFGLVLALRPAQAGRLYFANLLGGGMGALVSVAVLSAARAEVAVVWAALLGWGAAAAFHWRARSRRPWTEAVLALLLTALLVGVIRPWPFMAIRLSPYKALSQLRRAYDVRLEGTWWNAISRVDVVRSGTIHSLPGLSLSYSGAIPGQKGLLVDGDNLYPVTRATLEEAKFLDSLPVALAYRLAPRGRVLVLRPGGGLAAMAGLRYGAEEVVAVEANPLVAELLRGAYLEDSRGLYAQPRLTLAIEDERGFLGRDHSRYSLVHLALSDNYRAVTWGAYSLREDYLYTVEALAAAFRHLEGDGYLVVERWLQLPPSEETRAWATVVASLEKEGIAEPGAHLAALRSFQTVLILAKRTPLTEQDLAEIRQFAQAQGYDLVYLPDINREEANRFHIIRDDPYFWAFQEILDPAKRSDFFHRHPYDVRPASDGRPFFFHYFRLTQIPAILASFGRVWQPFGGGGYLVLVVLLGFALAASSVFILLPLALRAPPKEALPLPGRARVAVFSYFAALGLAYLLVEMPLLQYFILLLGQPTYAFALVLAALLFSSGLGSLWGEGRSRLWLAALAPLVGLYALFLGRWLPSLLGLAFPLRALSGVVLLAPLGALMGMPFPAGIRALGSFAPRYIPWAWAVNGCASVVGSILATMLAVSFGFAPVLGLAAGLYLVAALADACAFPRA